MNPVTRLLTLQVCNTAAMPPERRSPAPSVFRGRRCGCVSDSAEVAGVAEVTEVAVPARSTGSSVNQLANERRQRSQVAKEGRG